MTLSPLYYSASNVNPQHGCNVCRQLFTSKTKLFVHIKESGHALAVPADDDDDGSGSGGKNDGKKGRKSKR